MIEPPPPIDFAGLRTTTHERYSARSRQGCDPPTPGVDGLRGSRRGRWLLNCGVRHARGGQAVGALQAALTGHPAPPNPAGHGPPVRGRCGPPATRKAPATGSGQGQAAGHQVGRVQRLAIGGSRSGAAALRPSRRGSVTSHPPAGSTQTDQMQVHAHRRCRAVRVDLPPRFADSQTRASGLFRPSPCRALCVLP